MKNQIFTLIIFMFLHTGSSYAQKSINPKSIKMSGNMPAYRTCGTMDKLNEQMQNDPTLAGRMIETEKMIQNWIATQQDEINNNKTVVTIPVVVHVLWNATEENIADAKVQSQIDVLNKDYRKLNTDNSSVPAVWTNIASDFEIQFCLASKKPDGTATTGIERRQTSMTSFDQTGDPMKYYSQGGLDAWDATKYLNLWVCNLGGGLLGYAQFPAQLSSSPETDGVVILYSAFGLSGTSAAPYNLGRSATHEVGHWLNLRHIWGDDGGTCTGDDFCNDTPNSADATYGAPTFPKTDVCSPNNPGVMFMNYMDYTDDAYMYMFTKDQKNRAIAALNTLRSGLLTSNACQYTSNAGCDTLKAASYSWSCGDSIVFYKLNSPDVGYVTGNNSYGDKEKAQKVYINGSETVSRVICLLRAKTNAHNGNTYVKLYALDANTKGPGTLLGTSNAVSMASIAASGATTYNFAPPIDVSNAFFASVVLPTQTGDTLIVYSTKTTCSTTDSLAWEYWSNNTWSSIIHAYGGTNLDLAIFPVSCTGGASVEEKNFEKITVYPNPTNGSINVVLNNMSEEAIITVTNMIGQVLVKQTHKPASSKTLQLDISAQPSGIYYVNVWNDKKSISRKISLIK